MDFSKVSYEIHEKHHEERHDSALVEAWLQTDTVDYWRQKRFYSLLDPVLENEAFNWLTIGDGRMGSDAHYILSKGRKAFCTDISDHYLKIAKGKGLIEEFQTENAESMTFQSESFDFVLCKEAYHHFPRPYVALGEMLRVSRKGIAFIEPKDYAILPPYQVKKISPWLLLKRLLAIFKRRLTGGEPISILGDDYLFAASYEEVGNFVYSISERELVKAALGLNLHSVAFKGLNDYYIEGVEFEKTSANGPLFNKVKSEINQRDRSCASGEVDYLYLAAIIFKEKPSENTKSALISSGYLYHELTKNPHIR